MPQHTSKRSSTTGRKYQTARLPAGDYFGDNGRGGYAWTSRGKQFTKWHSTHKPDVSVEGSLLRAEPKSNKASEHDDTHKPFTNIPPSAGGVQLFEYTIDSETNNEERRQLNMPESMGGVVSKKKLPTDMSVKADPLPFTKKRGGMYSAK